MRYQCPCCGYYTYTLPPVKDYGFICPVCFWESDKHVKNEDDVSELNHGTVTMSQRRFAFNEKSTVCHYHVTIRYVAYRVHCGFFTYQ